MKFLLLLSLSLLGIPAVFAGSPDVFKSMTAVESGPFERGAHEVNVTSGFLYSPVIATGNRQVLNYVQGDVSLGCMLTSPAPGFGHAWLRGNWEAIGTLFGVGVVKGPGDFMAGGRLLLRYNFVQPDAKWVPFFQIGAGGLGDNIYEHRDQRVIGSGFEFTLVADAGVRYFFNPKLALMLMADFEHVSNAGTASRNLGMNAAGGMLGVGYFFR